MSGTRNTFDVQSYLYGPSCQLHIQGLFWTGSTRCLQLSLVNVLHSWYLQYIGVSTVIQVLPSNLYAYLTNGLPENLTLLHIAWPPRLFSRYKPILVQTSMTCNSYVLQCLQDSTMQIMSNSAASLMSIKYYLIQGKYSWITAEVMECLYS